MCVAIGTIKLVVTALRNVGQRQAGIGNSSAFDVHESVQLSNHTNDHTMLLESP